MDESSNTPPASPQYTTWLYRFGHEPETAASLEAQATEAARRGLPHGVSVFSYSDRPDAARAQRGAVELHFPVHKTGRNPYDYTIELPNPVTGATAAVFNRLFGRTDADE